MRCMDLRYFTSCAISQACMQVTKAASTHARLTCIIVLFIHTSTRMLARACWESRGAFVQTRAMSWLAEVGAEYICHISNCLCHSHGVRHCTAGGTLLRAGILHLVVREEYARGRRTVLEYTQVLPQESQREGHLVRALTIACAGESRFRRFRSRPMVVLSVK